VAGVSMRVTGADRVARRMRDFARSDLDQALAAAQRDAAKDIARAARRRAPRRSGALARSIGTRRNVVFASADHAGVIHWGWRRRGIAPQPFLTEALRDRIGRIRATYEQAVGDAARRAIR
jgi:hypothetical protein